MVRRSFVPYLALLLALAVVTLGCGGGALSSNHDHSTSTSSATSTSTGTTVGSTTSGATGGVSVSATKGGIVDSADAKAVLVVPAKSLSANTMISINPAVTTALPALPQNMVLIANTAYEFGPDGLFFNIAPSISLGYDSTLVPPGISERDLHIYTVVNGAWQPVLNSVDDPANHVISAPIAHFSVYAVLSVQNYSGSPAYDLVDLGAVTGDTASVPQGLSTNGRIVGISTSASGALHAFSWSQGLMFNLGARVGDGGAKALCVNSSGIAGGTSIQNPTASYPVLFTFGTVTQVATQSGMGGGAVTAINDIGDYIVGAAIVRSKALSPFGSFTPATGSAALNSSDQVAGTNGFQAASWQNGTVTNAGLLTGYDSSAGTAISEQGELVGTAFNAADNKPVGFVYSAGKMTKISPLSGDDILIPAAMNNEQVVGASTLDFTTSRGFIYSASTGTTQDLNTVIPASSGWTITQGIAINASGLIACTGVNGAQSHALLLVPRPGVAPAIKIVAKTKVPARSKK